MSAFQINFWDDKADPFFEEGEFSFEGCLLSSFQSSFLPLISQSVSNGWSSGEGTGQSHRHTCQPALFHSFGFQHALLQVLPSFGAGRQTASTSLYSLACLSILLRYFLFCESTMELSDERKGNEAVCHAPNETKK